MNGILDLFGINKEAQPVDAIRSGKELRENIETKNQVLEDLMKENPDLVNNLNTNEYPTTTGGITEMQPKAFTAINNLYNQLTMPRVGNFGIMDLVSTGKFIANPSVLGAAFSPIGTIALGALKGLGSLAGRGESRKNKLNLDIGKEIGDPYGYKGQLSSGNLGSRQDPFGRNLVSMFSDYEKNRRKEVARLSKIKDLNKFQKDLLDYGKKYLNKLAEKRNIASTPGFDVSGGAGGSYDRSFDYGADTKEAEDRRSSDLGFSDIRLKENIELVGKSPSDINIYKFNYKDSPTTYQGVMAHEVPWANVKHSNGYMMVDYNKIDVEFKKWQR